MAPFGQFDQPAVFTNMVSRPYRARAKVYIYRDPMGSISSPPLYIQIQTSRPADPPDLPDQSHL